MTKTNWQDPQTSEIRSTHISGLMEITGKLEDSIGMDTVAEANIPLTEVYISAQDRYRIFQAPAGKKNWLSSPAPVIKKNGIAIAEGFTIDYGGGAISLTANDAEENAYTADVTYVTPLATSFKSHVAETMQYEGRKFQINNPYKNGGALHLKGQMHCHSTNSDGGSTPADLVTAYKNAGYDFIAITDHEYITPDPGVSGIVFIQSVEESSPKHIPAYDVVEQSTSGSPQDIINFHRRRLKLCSIAHPTFNLTPVGKNEMIGFYDYNFLEIYNGSTIHYGSDSEVLNHWDWVLTSGKKVFALAVDDCHNIAQLSFNSGWVVVHAELKDKASILQSLRDGNFYASTGNDISISVEGNVITASSTVASNFSFIGENGRILQSNNGITSASYIIKGDEMYVRVKSVKVSDSTVAWSQPVFVDCLGDDGRIMIQHLNQPVSLVSGLTRDISIAGIQSIVLPFKAKSIFILAVITGTKATSHGFWSENNVQRCLYVVGDTGNANGTSQAIAIAQTLSDVALGSIQNITPTGFEINWTKSGSPTGTVTMMIQAGIH